MTTNGFLDGYMTHVQTLSSLDSSPCAGGDYVSGVSFARTASLESSSSAGGQPQGILMRHCKTEQPKKKKTVVFGKRYSVSAENEESAGRKVSEVEYLKLEQKQLEWEEERRSCLGAGDPFEDDDVSTDYCRSQRTRSRGLSTGDLDFADDNDDAEDYSCGRRRTKTAALEEMLSGTCDDDDDDGEAIEVLDSSGMAEDERDRPVRPRSKTMCHDLADCLSGGEEDEAEDCRRTRSRTVDAGDIADMLSDDDEKDENPRGRARSKAIDDDLADLLASSDEENQEELPRGRARSKTAGHDDIFGAEDDDDLARTRGGSLDTLGSKDSRRHEEMAMGHVPSAARSDCWSRPVWDIGQTAVLCGEGEEESILDKADLLEKFDSVAGAVEYLNSEEGYRELHEGICIVFSKTRRKYFLLYRTDQKAAALIIFNLTEHLDDLKRKAA